MLKLSDLALRPDLQIGPMMLSPSRRHVEGPAGKIQVEPLVMQGFLLLLDARGAVVTRDTLFDQCWGGVIVGDDSLNRVIAGVRRIAAEIGPGLFEIETIPRTGYRLIGELLDFAVDGEKIRSSVGEQSPDRSRVSRRLVLAGAGTAFGVAVLGGWALLRDRHDPRAAALVERGRQALRYGLPNTDQGVGYFRQATVLDSGNAAAWGWLAVAYREVAENAEPGDVAAAVQSCEQAARRALALDDKEGNALAALATIRPFFGDWYHSEQRFLRVLAIAPGNLTAIGELTLLLQAAGRCRESWKWNEHGMEIDPLSPIQHYRRALKHWIFGRIAQADLTIDRALQLWPRHPALWNARLMIFAFTGRARAALAMLDDKELQPTTLPEETIAFWRPSLIALDTRTSGDIAEARANNLAYAVRSPGYSTWAIMVTSSLGDLDVAFEITSGYFLRRGPRIGRLWTGSGQMPVNDSRWRRTMNLFTPVTAAMRQDPRFNTLCDGIGLTEYWKRRGIKPDYQLGII